ncbi:predicted protein [Uncinocarpus reesii 1704]|uniref:Uncharacterized protein n=1 Tax=Uncinocarpus reesii (strain UAMH 1704) TaxID=336963 RepID=C4JVJ3_UNCRE|nr:uncharacterized protein UREG_06585 [Uncinocarpus reesii 1704]EEP81720.1 predicted protein [Uncinocarpus reesii 1704]
MSSPRLTLISLLTSSMLTLLPILFAVPTAGRPSFEIFNGPAPPPDEGPPLSASAVRDLSLLWREIVAIIGAYLFIVFVFLGCLLTVGRRLRRSAQQSNRTLEMEMLKPLAPAANNISLQVPQSPQNTWPSPMSGTESHEWPSPQKSKARSFSLPWSKGQVPISRTDSVSTVDENVVRADRMRAQEEMERLYAAVMEHDEAKSNGGTSPAKSPRQTRSPFEAPPDFRQLRQRQQSLQSLSPVSPMSPLSRELPSPVYPEPQSARMQERHQQLQLQLQPQSPQFSYQETPEWSPTSPRSDKPSRLSALSFLSSKSSKSRGPKKLRRESVRNLPISPPILSPEAVSPGFSETQPLSPRIYHPGPPPLNPLQQQQKQQLKVMSRTPQLRNPSVDTNFSGPPHLHLRSAGSSTSTLPFRVAFDNGPMSAPLTKTTLVERRESILGPLGPRTGIPRTPYSPYMPFTPITPLTPSRMITREERKQMKKKNGVSVQTENDLVMSDEEMWS